MDKIPQDYRLASRYRRHLTKGQKARQTRILKAAMARRAKRREDHGIVIHYDRRAWQKLTTDQREAFKAGCRSHAFIGPRWDFHEHFHWFDDDRDAAGFLDHLFRFGSAIPRPTQSGREHDRECRYLGRYDADEEEALRL